MERALRHVLHFSLDAMGVDLVGEAFARLRWSGKEAKKRALWGDFHASRERRRAVGRGYLQV